MALEQEGSGASSRRAVVIETRRESRQNAVGILGLLRAGDHSRRVVSVPAVPSRGRISGRLQDPRAPFRAIGNAGVRGTSRARCRWRFNQGRAPPHHSGRKKILRLARAEIVLSHRSVVAPLRKRLPHLLRFREGEAGYASSGLDAQAQPSFRAAEDGESFFARFVDRVAPRAEHAGGAVVFPAIVSSAFLLCVWLRQPMPMSFEKPNQPERLTLAWPRRAD